MGLPVGAVTGISMRRASPLLLPCILTGGSRLFTPGLSLLYSAFFLLLRPVSLTLLSLTSNAPPCARNYYAIYNTPVYFVEPISVN